MCVEEQHKFFLRGGGATAAPPKTLRSTGSVPQPEPHAMGTHGLVFCVLMQSQSGCFPEGLLHRYYTVITVITGLDPPASRTVISPVCLTDTQLELVGSTSPRRRTETRPHASE